MNGLTTSIFQYLASQTNLKCRNPKKKKMVFLYQLCSSWRYLEPETVFFIVELGRGLCFCLKYRFFLLISLRLRIKLNFSSANWKIVLQNVSKIIFFPSQFLFFCPPYFSIFHPFPFFSFLFSRFSFLLSRFSSLFHLFLPFLHPPLKMYPNGLKIIPTPRRRRGGG